MVSIGHSQNISKEDRIKIAINSKGDTITTMSYSDSKLLLEDILKYQKSKEIISLYEVKEITYNNIIDSQREKLSFLEIKTNNLSTINSNLESILTNRGRELELANKEIDNLNKEIKRQKTKKVLGFIGAGVIAVTAILLAN